jgi:hypothetical protein
MNKNSLATGLVFGLLTIAIVLTACSQNESVESSIATTKAGINGALNPTTPTLTVLPAVTSDIQSNFIQLPANYRSRLVHYATIGRGSGELRRMFISPAAIEAVKQNRDLPSGTVVVMEDTSPLIGQNNQVVRDNNGVPLATEVVGNLFVREKRTGWGQEYPASIRNGEWDSAWFSPVGQRVSADLLSCLGCHVTARPSQHYLYTWQQLDSFARTGRVGYTSCDQSGRQPCAHQIGQ